MNLIKHGVLETTFATIVSTYVFGLDSIKTAAGVVMGPDTVN